MEGDETDQRQTSALYGLPLCLRCRQAGHVVNICPSTSWNDKLAWFFSEQRRRMDFAASAGESCRTELCQRCRDLDLPQFLHQKILWEDRDGLDRAELVGTNFLRSIGKTGSVVFWSNCSLCRCLFALTPNPSSKEQEVLMVPQWSITRLEGGAAANNEAKRSYAKCLLVFLNPSSINLPLADRAQRGDALCVLEEDNDVEYATTLGGRYIDPYQPDFGIVEEWMSSCCRVHQATCNSIWTENLGEIRLVDISTRHVVPYPGQGCEYVALSYVCGGVIAPSFQLGPIPSPLPRTIEDAMSWVKRMGKRYLWVDSLCINQRDVADKKRQINRLSDIYRGTFLNIVALTGSSADTGLPRLRSGSHMFTQLQCRIDGKRFVGLMPTLSQLIWVCPWGSRSWTLQEALLSPRSVYVSHYQLYFECNAMQCSESLNETRSWIHQLSRNSKPAGAEWSEAAVGGGVLRHPLVGLSGIKNNSLIEYGSALALYSCRSMTEPTDAVSAFAGILQNLEKEYGGSFFCGLPVSEFQWGLVWVPQVPHKRRLNEYPTWSWAAWEGPVWQTFPTDLNKPREFQPYLKIWRTLEDQTVQVFSSSSHMNRDMQYLDAAFPDDCASSGSAIAAFDSQTRVPSALHHDSVKKEPYSLFVEGIVFHFAPDYSQPLSKVRERGRHELFRFVAHGVECRIQIISIDAELEPWQVYRNSTIAVRPPMKQEEFLLVARDCSNGWVFHHLLLLHWQGVLATRRTALTLLVPDDRNSLQVLKEFGPRKKQFVLC